MGRLKHLENNVCNPNLHISVQCKFHEIPIFIFSATDPIFPTYPNSHIKALTPNEAVFGDGAFIEALTIKQYHKDKSEKD